MVSMEWKERKKQMQFTAAGMLTGARQCLPLPISVFAYGIVFGVLARQAKLSVLEAFLMSALVNAGAAQLVVLSLWAMPLPILTIIGSRTDLTLLGNFGGFIC